MTDIGNKAPMFSLLRDGGERVSLSDFKGKPLVVFFYPKDNTPGCTKEAIDFTQQHQDFSKLGVQVLGVSRDTVRKHENFAKKHSLSIPLLSDEDGTMCADYGVWVEKNMYGRKYMGIERSTFVIDAKGTIVRVWRKVKVAGHVTDVLDFVKTL